MVSIYNAHFEIQIIKTIMILKNVQQNKPSSSQGKQIDTYRSTDVGTNGRVLLTGFTCSNDDKNPKDFCASVETQSFVSIIAGSSRSDGGSSNSIQQFDFSEIVRLSA